IERLRMARILLKYFFKSLFCPLGQARRHGKGIRPADAIAVAGRCRLGPPEGLLERGIRFAEPSNSFEGHPQSRMDGSVVSTQLSRLLEVGKRLWVFFQFKA